MQQLSSWGSLWETGRGSSLSTQQAESMSHPRLEPEGSQPQEEATVVHDRMLSWKGWCIFRPAREIGLKYTALSHGYVRAQAPEKEDTATGLGGYKDDT